jgi:hypothetical protein
MTASIPTHHGARGRRFWGPCFALACLCALASRCSRSSDNPRESVSAGATSSMPESGAAPISTSTGKAGKRPRDIHPIGGPDCIEMYTVCMGDAHLCTSAPLILECGQTGDLPSTGERLRCVCP